MVDCSQAPAAMARMQVATTSNGIIDPADIDLISQCASQGPDSPAYAYYHSGNDPAGWNAAMAQRNANIRGQGNPSGPGQNVPAMYGGDLGPVVGAPITGTTAPAVAPSADPATQDRGPGHIGPMGIWIPDYTTPDVQATAAAGNPSGLNVPEMYGGDLGAVVGAPGRPLPTPPGVPGAGDQDIRRGYPNIAAGAGDPSSMVGDPSLSFAEIGGPQWLVDAGIDPLYVYGHDPADPQNQLTYLDLYAKQQGLPDYWGAQVQPFYNSLAGLYAIDNPQAGALSATQQLGLMDELKPGGALNTPGSYLDVGGEWDKLLGGGVIPGMPPGQQVAGLPPEQQLAAVRSALGVLAPYIGQDTAQLLDLSVQREGQKWLEDAVATGGVPTYDFLTHLQMAGADDWIA